MSRAKDNYSREFNPFYLNLIRGFWKSRGEAFGQEIYGSAIGYARMLRPEDTRFWTTILSKSCT